MSKISFEERLLISKYLNQGLSIRKIAYLISRSASSLSEEIRRQGMNQRSYNPYVAQEHANIRKGSSKRSRKIQGCLEEIVDMLLIEKHFSPEQISGYIKKHYPCDQSIQVCPETIYRYIYSSKKARFYIPALRRRRKKRRARKKMQETRGRIPDLVSIEQRPKEVDRRNIFGHWEGDLIIGKDQKTALGTLVERSMRYTIIVPFIEGRDSISVIEGFAKALENLPEYLKKSLTYDQGSEMTYHKKFSDVTGMKVYFAHKSSPWERGTNENTNGLIREFFPRGTDFRAISEKEFTRVQGLLNQRPRKVLGFATPEQILRASQLDQQKTLEDCLRLV